MSGDVVVVTVAVVATLVFVAVVVVVVVVVLIIGGGGYMAPLFLLRLPCCLSSHRSEWWVGWIDFVPSKPTTTTTTTSSSTIKEEASLYRSCWQNSSALSESSTRLVCEEYSRTRESAPLYSN